MHSFSDSISTHGLIDIPLEGGNFTWSNNRELASMSRIDRFLSTSDWEECFSFLVQCKSSRICSDHFLILLKRGSI